MAISNAAQALPFADARPLKYASETILKGVPNPRKIANAADWFVARHTWARLVEIGNDGQTRPYLASKFTRSHDGLTWTFEFPKGLRWSDGSPMTVDQIKASIELTLKGTAHLGVARYVKQVRKKGEAAIVFELHRLPASFLSSLAFADFSITDGEVVPEEANKSPGQLRTCGPFRIVSAAYGKLVLKPNPHFFAQASLGRNLEIHGLAQGDAFMEFVRNEKPDVLYLTNDMTEEQKRELNQAGFKAFQTSPHASVVSLQLGQKGADRISAAKRRWLLKKAWKALSSDPRLTGLGAAGIRPKGLFGSLPSKQWESLLDAIPDELPEGEDKTPFEIFIVKSLLGTKTYEAIHEFFERSKIPVKEVLYDLSAPDSPETKRRFSRDFDFYLAYQGVSDPDPDTMWHYIQRPYKPDLRFIPEKDLEDALFEQDVGKREEKYRAFERRHVEDPFIIPLQMIGGTVFVRPPLLPPEDGNFEWGVQLWKFREGA